MRLASFRSIRRAMFLIFTIAVSVAGPALAQDDPAKDALIVETLLRLENFDLEAKPKTKAAVLRFLQANPGSESFFQLIERFQIKDAAGDLIALATTKPGETAGVKSAELLLKLAPDRISETLTGDDSASAAALVQALGTVGGNEVNARLMPLVTDDERPLAVRSAAAAAVAKSKAGAEFLLGLAKDKKLSEDLNFTVANALFASPDPAVKEEAAKHLKLPAAVGAKPLPPLAELVQMKGDSQRGKELFANKGTCSKCHVVGGQGKEVGPNLSEIGNKLSKEAFLVAILDPSAGISHNYETFVAITDDGKVLSGILVSQTDEQVVLKDAESILHTLKMENVEELKKLKTSLMPADLQKLLTAEELVDIVEYLQTLKKG